MTTTFTRTAIATVFIATIGLTGPAMAAIEHFDTDKASTTTKAVPAAEIVERHAGQMVSGPTEKPGQIVRTTPAFAATGMEGTFVATHPTGMADAKR